VRKGITADFDTGSGEFRLSHPSIGLFLKGLIAVSWEGGYGCSSDPRYKKEILSEEENRLVVRCRSPEESLPDFTAEIRTEEDLARVVVSIDKGMAGDVEVHGEVFMGPEPYLGRAIDEENHGIFSVSYGPVSSSTAKTLFNRFNDSALSLPKSRIYHVRGEDPSRYRFVSFGASGEEVFVAKVRLDLIKGFGIRYYSPIDKSVFTHAPTGWCTWYYYYQGINEWEWEKNVDWLADNLKKFGLEWVQLDDGWQLDNGSRRTSGGRDWRGPNEKFPRGMEWVARKAKERGLKPGIWLIPQKTDSDEVYNSNQDWFLRKPDGTPVKIGDWHPRGVGSYVIDPTNPEALECYLKSLFHMIAFDWGFDYFKIDNQPEFSRWFDENSDARKYGSIPGSEAYRMTLKAIREVIGPNKYLLGCYGIPLDGIGFMNGSRTGGDMSASWEGCQVMIRTITRWGFLNNVVWWCDPDTLCVREPLTLGEARIMATIVSLSGQALMTSDKMYELPPERVEILKRVMPTVSIKPMEFYPWDEKAMGRPNIIDLKVEKHYGSWDVVAVFNWEEEPIELYVDFAKLGLPIGDGIEYHVFSFWDGKYEGAFSEGIKVVLETRTCKVLWIRPCQAHPQVVSTSRHITGIVDLMENVWDPVNCELHGKSKVVGGDPYRIYIHVPKGRYAFSSIATHGDAKAFSRMEDEILVLELLCDENADIEWTAKFSFVQGG
jgi:hypothetical protein